MKQKTSGSWLPAIMGAAVCIAVLAFALCNRLSHLREEAEYNAYLESISRFAKEYVLGKYGFEAEITEDEGFDNRSKWEWNKEFPGYIQARFKMTDPAGRTFFTYLQGDPLNLFGDFIYGGRELHCYDYYQEKEIGQAVADRITRAFPGGHTVNIELHGRLPYYSGDNLDEILSGIDSTIEMVFPPCDMSSPAAAELMQWLAENEVHYSFLFLENEEITEKFAADKNPWENTVFCQEPLYELYAPYIRYKLTDSSSEPEEIKLSECGDFLYGYFPALSNDRDFGMEIEDVEIYEFDRDLFTTAFENADEAEWVSRPLSESYLFGKSSGTMNDILIYYPLEKLSQTGTDIENIGAAWVRQDGKTDVQYPVGFLNAKTEQGDNSKPRGIEKARICGDYAVFRLRGNELSFMLTDISGQGEYVSETVKIIMK